MPPEYHQPNDLWNQDTELLPIVDYDPVTGPRRRSRAVRYVVIGLAAVLVGSGLGAAAYFASHQLGSVADNTAAQTTTQAPTTSTTSAAPVPSSPPAAGAPLSSLLAWIQAGKSVDISNFHTATAASGTVNDLGSAVAFVSPSKKIQCMTPKEGVSFGQGGLTCLVTFDDPPARPKARPSGQWVGGWVDFPGATLGIGHLAGDPGQFILGDGATLAYGSRLTFGGFDCRMDESGLYCANKSGGGAMQLSSAGATPYGCLGKIGSQDYGIEYSCTATGETATTTPAPSQTRTAPAVGDRCDTPGQQAKSASGIVLTCDTAGDSGLRWRNKPATATTSRAPR